MTDEKLFLDTEQIGESSIIISIEWAFFKDIHVKSASQTQIHQPVINKKLSICHSFSAPHYFSTIFRSLPYFKF